MKSVLVIGLGRFGRHLAKKLAELGNDVMVVDRDPEKVGAVSAVFPDSHIGDCTNENVLRSLGVTSFDLCFVAVGEDFQSSLVITSLLKRLGAKHVVAKAQQDIQSDLLIQIGADEAVCPDRDIAEKLAVRYNAKNVFDYIDLTSDYALYEIPVPAKWANHSLAELDVRRKYRINIIAIKKGDKLGVMPGPEYLFNSDDHVVIIGKSTDVVKLTYKT